jgi:ubiquinone/menaquinone biosynthesis C-methylase UbiE
MKVFFVLFTWLAFSGMAAGQDARHRDQHQMQRLHRDPQAYIGALEDPKRDAYQKPQEVMQALALKTGEAVADIGAGSGYFTFRLARQVGPAGKIYAVDVSPDMIRHINRRIRDGNFTNVVSVLADPDDPLLPERSVNRFFICDVWHHVDKQTKYLSLMKKMLKSGGEIIMIDFHTADIPVGPPPQMRIDREELLKQMESNGFRLKQEHTFLPYQYFLVFAPN